MECGLFLEALLCEGEQRFTSLKQYSVYCHCVLLYTLSVKMHVIIIIIG